MQYAIGALIIFVIEFVITCFKRSLHKKARKDQMMKTADDLDAMGMHKFAAQVRRDIKILI